MAAKKLIQGLQDRSNETSKKQIIKLACTYGNIEFKMNTMYRQYKIYMFLLFFT